MNYKSPIIPVITMVLSLACFLFLKNQDGTRQNFFLVFTLLSAIRLGLWAYIKYVKKLDGY